MKKAKKEVVETKVNEYMKEPLCGKLTNGKKHVSESLSHSNSKMSDAQRFEKRKFFKRSFFADDRRKYTDFDPEQIIDEEPITP